eukprot:scaffold28898_cov37-Prasinocladus_malaysianus.AAC.3
MQGRGGHRRMHCRTSCGTCQMRAVQGTTFSRTLLSGRCGAMSTYCSNNYICLWPFMLDTGFGKYHCTVQILQKRSMKATVATPAVLLQKCFRIQASRL